MKPSELLSITGNELGKGTNIKVDIVETEVDLYNDIARVLYDAIADSAKTGKQPVFIIPVGPVGQYRRLARLCNLSGLSCSDAVFINMDEYLDELGEKYIEYNNPLSFRRYMDEQFYNMLDEDKKVPQKNKIFPDPKNPKRVQEIIEEYGGVDICIGGVGINGHIAFNEPPAPELNLSSEEFSKLPTRVIEIDIRTKVINAATSAKGNIDDFPNKAITVGMKEILSAKSIFIYMARDWHPTIARRWMHGPITPQVPASMLQNHKDVHCVITPEVAQPAISELK